MEPEMTVDGRLGYSSAMTRYPFCCRSAGLRHVSQMETGRRHCEPPKERVETADRQCASTTRTLSWNPHHQTALAQALDATRQPTATVAQLWLQTPVEPPGNEATRKIVHG
jgi:hypothetical protein